MTWGVAYFILGVWGLFNVGIVVVLYLYSRREESLDLDWDR